MVRPTKAHGLNLAWCLAIEPMVNAGSRYVKTLADNWTVVTVDGKKCAHFEHTIAITDTGFDILTKSLGDENNSEDIFKPESGRLSVCPRQDQDHYAVVIGIFDHHQCTNQQTEKSVNFILLRKRISII